MRSELDTLRALARHLAGVRATTPEQISLYGLMTGALYSLCRAAELDFDDARALPDVDVLNLEFQSVAANIKSGATMPLEWLAGFYFHSAIMRLDAVDTRLSAALHLPDPKGGVVREAVNSLKHDQAAHVSGDHIVVFGDAVAKAQTLCSLLQTWMKQTAQPIGALR